MRRIEISLQGDASASSTNAKITSSDKGRGAAVQPARKGSLGFGVEGLESSKASNNTALII